MKPDKRPPAPLLEQLVANSAALCRADRKLKKTNQHRDEPAQFIEIKMAVFGPI